MIYIPLVIFNPGIPSYYTFTITSLAFVLTLSTNILTLLFFYTRPAAQKTLLNRLLSLLFLAGVVGSTRCYIMCFMGTWFHHSLNDFIRDHQTFSSIVMPLHSYSVLVAGSFLLLCASRFLLFAQPAWYHRINPNKGVSLAGGIILLICVLDSLYSWGTCRNYADHTNIRQIKLLKGELGLPQNNTCNISTPTQDDKNECNFFPTILSLAVCGLCFELAKVCVLTWKKIAKERKKAKVQPTIFQLKLGPDAVRCKSTREIKRSESYPKISPALKNRAGRRHSTIGLTPLQQLSIQSNKQANSILQKDNHLILNKIQTFKIVKKSFRSNCYRSSSIITLFALVCLVSSVVNTFTNNTVCSVYSDSMITGNRVVRMFVYFCFSVCIFLFDKELFTFFLDKFHSNTMVS